MLTTGTSDPMWTTTNANAAAAHLSRGALVVLPGAGHIGPLLQAVRVVVELVTAFWQDPDASIADRRGAASPRPPRTSGT
jgi:pimeloyl-ACP methyl ester carboxylesterase